MADLEVGDIVEIKSLPREKWEVISISPTAGVAAIKNKRTGELGKFFVSDLIPAKKGPQGSLITW